MKLKERKIIRNIWKVGEFVSYERNKRIRQASGFGNYMGSNRNQKLQ